MGHAASVVAGKWGSSTSYALNLQEHKVDDTMNC